MQVVVNFISAQNVEIESKAQDIEKLEQEFPSVEGMIKTVSLS